jgi:magnesium transporter
VEVFTKRHPKHLEPGAPPGTLPEPEAGARGPLTIRMVDYTGAEVVDRELTDATDCLPYLQGPTRTWIHVQGAAEADTLRELGRIFDLHPLALEDVVLGDQRPKAERYGAQLFMILADPEVRDGRVVVHQVSLFLGDRFVISFHTGPTDPFGVVRTRIRHPEGRMRSRGPDYMFYALADLIIDRGFPALGALGDRIEDLEDDLLERPSRNTPRELHAIKRDLLALRRKLWPQREAVNAVMRDDGGLVTDETRVYLRDCYDHAIQVMDLVESYRDVTAGLLDLYLSSVSNRLNEVMKVLTVIATIFIPLTFITGLYGMNFSNPESPWDMPELHWYWGYPYALGLMAVVAIGMLGYFKRKGWF